MGFKELHPENMPKNRRVIKEDKRRLELANKLIPAKGITTAEKAEIYKFLTGMDYPAKRGRPSEIDRNMKAALDFLSLMGETAESKDDIMRSLASLYNLPGGEKSANSSVREIDDVNFNKIIVQQLDRVESYLIQYVDAVENGLLASNAEIYKNSKTCLKGLEKYRARKNPKK